MLSSNRFFGNAGRSRWMAGVGLPAYASALQDWTRTELATGMPKHAAVPLGYGGAAWALPRVAGSLTSRGKANLSFTASGSVSQGLPVEGSAAIALAAEGSAIGIGSVAGSAALTLLAAGNVYGQATVAGSAAVTLSASGVVGGLAFVSGSASMSLTAASTMGCTAAVAGGAFLSGAAEGNTLTESGIAGAVWSAVAASYNTAGTMGAKLNTASSGGVDLDALAGAVWAYATRTLTSGAGGLTTEQANQLQDIFRIHGLDEANPLEVTPTSRTAGGVVQDVATAGDTVTVSRVP